MHHQPLIGIGLDSCITPLKASAELSLIQTTDFFYPLVDDPYIMGRIACANVLSDLYATGAVDCDNMLMLLGVSTDFSEQETEIVIPMMLEGFRDCAAEAGTSIQGGQTVKNPWLTIGGVATAVCSRSQFIVPDGAKVGDVLVLTKALGTQIAVNAYEWLSSNPTLWAKIAPVVSREGVMKAYNQAVYQMARINRNGARLMQKHNARACTDVTGFGIIGHAHNLAAVQKATVTFRITSLPIIANMAKAAEASGVAFGLMQGYSAETSGGLLIAMSADDAASFISDMQLTEGEQAWIVGSVESGENVALIDQNATVVEVA